MLNQYKCIGCCSFFESKRSDIVTCIQCGLLFSTNLKAIDYSEAYIDDHNIYNKHFNYLNSIHLYPNPLKKLTPFESSIIEHLGKASEVYSIADIGCGIGRFLRALRHNGFKSIGYELSAEIVSHLRKHGCDVRVGTADTFIAAPISADGVSMLEVIEHLPDPNRVVQGILETKQPKQLFVVVPNWFTRRIYDKEFALHDVPPNHLSWWSIKSLSYLLKNDSYETEITEIAESRKNLIYRFLVNKQYRSFSGLFKFFSTLIKPPIFWYLGIVTKK